jgi:membrane fusion protein, adhesin transport system
MKNKNPPSNFEEQASYNEDVNAVGSSKRHPGKSNYSDENDDLEVTQQSIGKIETKKVSAETLALDTQVEGVSKFSFGKPQKDDEEDVEFMSPVTGAYKHKPKSWGPVMLYTIGAFFGLTLVWSFFAPLDQITRGQGQVIPSGQTKIIDHLEGGIVKEIKVKEGDIVDAGQVLMLVDATVAKDKYAEGLQLYYRTQAQIARLQAQTSGKPFVMPEEVTKNAPAIAEKEMALYQEAKKKIENERQIASNELEQRNQEYLQATAHVEQLENRLKLAEEELTMMEPLVKSGVSPKIEWIKLQRDVSDTKGELATAKVAVPKAQAAIGEAKQKLDQVEITIRGDENRELRDAQSRWTDIKDNTVKDLDRLQRTEIRSPVRGTIKELKINTIGGVIQPGKDLIAIVPLEDQLLVEAQVSPADVAFLRPGMRAVVKITSYDYGIYGGLDATLLDISADTLIDEKSRDPKQFFRIRLKTDKNYLGTETKRLPISPGMSAQVDIMTGKKTVWQYIMKPILKSKDNALTER